MRNTLSVLYIVRKNRKDKNGLCRISVRITIQGKAVECNTPMKIPPELWDTRAGYAVGRTKLATETNTTIRLISCRISEIYNRQFIEDGYTTAALVRNEFLGIKLISKTVLGLMDKKIENKKKQVGISIKPESVTNMK